MRGCGGSGGWGREGARIDRALRNKCLGVVAACRGHTARTSAAPARYTARALRKPPRCFKTQRAMYNSQVPSVSTSF